MKPFALLAAALAAAYGLALFLGEQALAPRAVAAALSGAAEPDDPTRFIVLELRLPRATLAALVGAALAVGGTIAQAILRNPLAEPGLLGINGGAALAAMVVIVELGHPSPSLLPWLTFSGALVMALAILALARAEGAASARLILIGVGLSSMAGAGATFIATFGEIADVQRAMIWLAGSLQGGDWGEVRRLIAWAVAPAALVWLAAGELDVIALGDEVAAGRGQPVPAARAGLVVACALVSGAAVAAAGLIAFVGLAAPHLARRLVGARHDRLLPAAALIGALLVLVADLAARSVLPPIQLPVGLVTALLGAPFFAWLLRVRHDG
ncbi:MAG: iron ABC transporter permease [Rhodovulum sulfidophilum]|uniref:Iron ABC transporter permease n=1 Tax=Rhodovulum sulfidophilum TaxID=35806 RepID=A0A2W5N0Y8_RHOSU|nr:MAG: iron ABC transporter permease [Rhodovulum sulfidophilum]